MEQMEPAEATWKGAIDVMAIERPFEDFYELELTVPNMPVEGEGDDRSLTRCIDGNLKSWVAAIDTSEPGDAFYGYTGPGYTEEFWILDVEGTRLMIEAEWSLGSPRKDLAEMSAILDSIRIEP
jgi:hypothetical protein